MPKKPTDFETLREIALKMPGVEATTSWGAMSLKLHGKLFVCQAMHKSAAPNSVMVRVGFEARAGLIANDPDTYYVTAHYTAHPFVLVRLTNTSRPALRSLLESAWQAASTAPSRSKRTAAARAKTGAKTRVPKL